MQCQGDTNVVKSFQIRVKAALIRGCISSKLKGIINQIIENIILYLALTSFIALKLFMLQTNLVEILYFG